MLQQINELSSHRLAASAADIGRVSRFLVDDRGKPARKETAADELAQAGAGTHGAA